jgi:hypothetical protein
MNEKGEEIKSVGPLVSTCNEVEKMLMNPNMSNKEKKAMGHQAIGMAVWKYNEFGKDFTKEDKEKFREKVPEIRNKLEALEDIPHKAYVEIPIMGTGFTMQV